MERWAVELDALKCYTTRVGCMSRHWEGGYGLSLVCTKCCWILLLLLLLHLFSFRRRLQALMPQRGPSQLELQRDYVNRVFHKCGQHRYFTLQPYYQHAFVQTYCNHHWHNAAAGDGPIGAGEKSLGPRRCHADAPAVVAMVLFRLHEHSLFPSLTRASKHFHFGKICMFRSTYLRCLVLFLYQCFKLCSAIIIYFYLIL